MGGWGLTSVETYRTCDFPGEGVRTPFGSARGYDRSKIFKSSVKPIAKDRFSYAIMVHFPLLERQVTLQNMMRYMILDILSGSTLNIQGL